MARIILPAIGSRADGKSEQLAPRRYRYDADRHDGDRRPQDPDVMEGIDRIARIADRDLAAEYQGAG